MKLKAQAHWEKLNQNTIKKRNRNKTTGQLVSDDAVDQGQQEEEMDIVFPDEPNHEVAGETGN